MTKRIDPAVKAARERARAAVKRAERRVDVPQCGVTCQTNDQNIGMLTCTRLGYFGRTSHAGVHFDQDHGYWFDQLKGVWQWHPTTSVLR